MAECFPEKSSWCLADEVCQGVKCKVLYNNDTGDGGNDGIYDDDDDSDGGGNDDDDDSANNNNRS